ncbi:cysteine proteinase [Rhizodiscina lignyota]|uniref:Ubiquitin carboxyl-terminal hydrolase n=1 Tax=Rhizodiscina lignyota TaxID=1504668 RepID=A0A9P4MBS1_9PEZI|nr:cysteine proteinase [Rhizodiscina lignyota]
MSRSSKRRKMTEGQAAKTAKDEMSKEIQFPNPPTAPATDDDRRKWQGWCEIESEPAFFNSILNKWGVKGTRVQEVLCLDDETLNGLPKPIHGIIFLFRFCDLDEEQEEQEVSNQVWFANQRVQNACASVALLNLVMNIPNVELGKHISRFKDSTKDMSPTERGRAVAEFAFVRQAHNSWARKSDMLYQDLAFKNEFDKAKRYRNRGTKARNNKKKKPEEDDTNGFHFIAFMPASGEIWRMDGMEKQPQKFGSYSDDSWVTQVAAVMQERMALFANEGIQFNVLAMTKDPLLIAQERLAENIKSLAALEARLDEVQPGWRHFVADGRDQSPIQQQQSLTPKSMSDRGIGGDSGEPRTNGTHSVTNGTAVTAPEPSYPLIGPEPAYGIDSFLIDKACVLTRACHILENDPNLEPSTLLQLHQNLVIDQARLRSAYEAEERSQRDEEERADGRTWDYGPLVREWVRYLAEAEDPDTRRSVLETLIKESEIESP